MKSIPNNPPLSEFTLVPTKWIDSLSIISGERGPYETCAPLATYEIPLWPSVQRGASLTKRAGGIRTTLLRNGMARSILVETESAAAAVRIRSAIEANRNSYITTCENTSRFLKVSDFHYSIIASMLHVRIEAVCGDASGHNMITKAADALLKRICADFPEARHVSVSSNFCTDKKVSSVNAILGRGKSVIAEVLIPRKLCSAYLKTSPEAIVELNTKKNLLGSIISGAVQSANAHYANMLLGIYLATGQDVANIVEGSQGITYCEMRGDDLYFSVSLPNIIVGTVGNGKSSPGMETVFEKMGCAPEQQAEIGQASSKLAEIVAAVVLCGELSLLGAQTIPGELISSHIALERQQKHQ